jgi:hypothetical protein
VPEGYVVANGRMQSFAANAVPRIGDVMIEYTALRPQVVSMVAEVRQGRLVAHQTQAGDSLAMITPGAVSAQEMFQVRRANSRDHQLHTLTDLF